ncbi:MAG: DUF4276 family protein [Terriglobales bacterium]
MSLRVYIEGGGTADSTRACREAFCKLFDCLNLPQKPKLVSCGSRNDAYSDFKTALATHGTACILLVDSEDPVQAQGADAAWTHLLGRDRWAKPANTSDCGVQLMVQCMENWFLADRNAVASRFNGAKVQGGPGHLCIEDSPKKDTQAWLESVAKQFPNRQYHKVNDGFEILAALDFNKVRQRSPFADRLGRALSNWPNCEPPPAVPPTPPPTSTGLAPGEHPQPA